MNDEIVLETKSLTKWFKIRASYLDFRPKLVHAVDGVSLKVNAGETLAVVGESGCGKSTLARLALRLIEPTQGTVHFKGDNVTAKRGKDLLSFRKQAQIVFQDPGSALNPRKTTYQILRDPMLLHKICDRKNAHDLASKVLELVGLMPASTYLERNPHEFSGGQRQRINIARAISIEPRFLVADEPVSSLDISIRAQILELLKKIQIERGLALLFITHDLAVVRSIAHRVAVMYLGNIVEIGPVEQIFKKPFHPYTKALLSATPIPDPEKSRNRERIVISGEAPSAINPPSGCRFHTRCPYIWNRCVSEIPFLQTRETEKREVACHLMD